MSKELTAAETLAAFGESLSYQDLPPMIAEDIKSRILDFMGICVAATQLESSRVVQEYVRSFPAGGSSTAIGIAGNVMAEYAAFMNGVLAHSLDYDDTHLPSVLHPSAVVIPAVLAVAEEVGSSPEEVIVAIAFGLEVTIRLGMAGYDREKNNSLFFEYGQHATSICGSMGASAAVAKLIGNAETIQHALGVNASMAAGIIESNRTGGNVKRLHCGWAAHSAVSAAKLAKHGITGPPTVLEGRFGFFWAWLKGEFFPEELTRNLGTDWAILDIFFKPYPANHFTHAVIDCGIQLREMGILPEQIQSVVLGVPGPAKRTIGEPLEVKQNPQTGYMAQFSAPFAFASGLIGGGGLGVGLDDFTDEKALDPNYVALMAKVDVVEDEECTQIFPNQFPAKALVTLVGGKELRLEVLVNRGGNKNPLSFEELRKKFLDNATRV
ncbi:MAG: MmgE/PrpD family protein, partial [Microbacteriaceae bacterium]